MTITEIVLEEERFISEKARNKAMREYRKNYMAFDGFDNLTKYLTGKNAAEIRLFIRTLTDDPDFGDVDSRVVNMAEKILKDKTE